MPCCAAKGHTPGRCNWRWRWSAAGSTRPLYLATSIRISPTELLDYYREAMTWATAEVGNG